MTVPKWPLPLGHVFGPSRHHITHHTGRRHVDALNLRMWQNRFCGHWRRPWMHPSGQFDGPTQRAVLEVQERAGLPRTGLLGPREWAACWELGPPPKPAPPPRQKKGRTPRKVLQKRRRYFDKFRALIEMGTEPDAPEWFPGRPFGPHIRADYVKRVQETLGFKPTGYYSVHLGQRVAGLQRAHGLPVSGVVDVRTAQLIDELAK